MVNFWTRSTVGVSSTALNDRSDVVVPDDAERDASARGVGSDVQRVLDALPWAVFLVDSTSLVRGSNVRAKQLVGLSGGQLAGRCLFDLMTGAGDGVGPAQASDLQTTFSAVVKGQTLVQAVELRQPDDDVVSVVAQFAPWVDDRGAVIGAVFAVDDSTATSGSIEIRSRAADLSDQLSLALAAGDIGTWSVDLATGIVRGDETFAGLVGLDSDSPECTFDEWLRMLHPDDVESTRAAVEEAIRTRSFYDGEHRILAFDGTVRWGAERGSATLDAGRRVTGISGFTADINERKQVEMYRGGPSQLR